MTGIFDSPMTYLPIVYNNLGTLSLCINLCDPVHPKSSLQVAEGPLQPAHLKNVGKRKLLWRTSLSLKTCGVSTICIVQ